MLQARCCLRRLSSFSAPKPSVESVGIGFAVGEITEVGSLFGQRQRKWWTLEETKKLHEAYTRYDGNWNLVCQEFPDLKRGQIMNRWKRTRNPNRKIGGWSPVEDESLLEGLDGQPHPFSRIAAASGVRTPVQVYQRYANRWKPRIVPLTKPRYIRDEQGRLVRQSLSFDEAVQKVLRAQKVEKEAFQLLPPDANRVHRRSPYRKLRPFTPDEDVRLLNAYKAYGGKWRVIAWDFQDRSNKELHDRYWRLVVKRPFRRPVHWTSKEDQTLLKGYERFKGGTSVWKTVTEEVLPTRTPREAQRRWSYISCKPYRKPFTTDEHNRLLAAVKKYIAQADWPIPFSRIQAESFPDRTTLRLQSYYHKCIQPTLHPFEWTPERDQMLLERAKDLSYAWATMTKKYFPQTTSHIVSDRYERLMREIEPEWTPEQDDALVDMVMAEGGAFSKIARRMGRSRTTVSNRVLMLVKSGRIDVDSLLKERLQAVQA
ncbi:hypothetical protein DFS34DRAFT_601181 [Phlyctochytrium arcticum]|nr:hypothetical protein DFS34DRAFT_601181 [Phlyctochytrium arcticum]